MTGYIPVLILMAIGAVVAGGALLLTHLVPIKKNTFKMDVYGFSSETFTRWSSGE